MAAKSTLHGHTFEEQLGDLLTAEAVRLNDIVGHSRQELVLWEKHLFI
jgi:hypothetical protein